MQSEGYLPKFFIHKITINEIIVKDFKLDIQSKDCVTPDIDIKWKLRYNSDHFLQGKLTGNFTISTNSYPWRITLKHVKH